MFFSRKRTGGRVTSARSRLSSHGRIGRAVIAYACLASSIEPRLQARSVDPADGLAGSGLSMIPSDAVFASSSLRLREQYKRLLASQAGAALVELGNFEELIAQAEPALSTVRLLLSLPENQQATDLLTDMLAHDTFVYGDASWLNVVDLIKRVQQAQKAHELVTIFEDDAGDRSRRPADVLLKTEKTTTTEKGEASTNTPTTVTVDMKINAPAIGAMFRAAARHPDLLVVPATVWGFRTSMQEAARTQIKRIEVLARMVAEQYPQGGLQIDTRSLHGAELLTLTLRGSTLPWEQLAAKAATQADRAEIDRVIDRLKTLDLVVATGLIGDHVILSLGGSTDHLDRLVVADSVGPALLAIPAFEPLRAAAAEPLTGVSYASESLIRRLSATPADLEELRAMVREAAIANEIPPEHLTRKVEMLEQYARLCCAMPAPPGAWMSFAYLTDRGYAGHAWDWTRPPLVGPTERLGILDHAGGSPLAVMAGRMQLDQESFDADVKCLELACSLMKKTGTAEGIGFSAVAIAETAAPFLTKMIAIIRERIVPENTGGEYALVIDAADPTRQLHKALPSTPDALPLFAPAAIVTVRDIAQARCGLEAILSAVDEFHATIALQTKDRTGRPAGATVGGEFRVPRPERATTPAGEIWTFPVPELGLDSQFVPTIAFGEKFMVFSLVPGQARRLLESTPLKTGADLARFDQPLAAAAAFDSAATVAALEPWVDYAVRCWCAVCRGETVDGQLTVTAADHTAEAKRGLARVGVILRMLQSLRTVVAETEFTPDATVTHWRNRIEDFPGGPSSPATAPE